MSVRPGLRRARQRRYPRRRGADVRGRAARGRRIVRFARFKLSFDRDALLNSPLVWVNGGIFLACWLFGAWHAWRAHAPGSALGALLLPPYGLYMAAESEFGHARRQGAAIGQVADAAAAESACRGDTEIFEKSGLTREQFEIWCACSSQMIAERFTPAEADFVRRNGANSPAFTKVIRGARQSCFATARYLGGGPAQQNADGD